MKWDQHYFVAISSSHVREEEGVVYLIFILYHFYTLQFQRSLNLNEDDVDHSVCPRSSYSAALFLSDICSRTHQQRNTGKWWSFIRHIFPRIMFFIWQHNLRKEPDSREKSLRNSASVGKRWRLWRCRGVLHIIKQGIPQSRYAFISRKWTKCSDLNLIPFKLTINLNNFYSNFLCGAEFKAGLFPFLRKGR